MAARDISEEDDVARHKRSARTYARPRASTAVTSAFGSICTKMGWTLMHPQLASCHVKPRQLDEEGNGPSDDKTNPENPAPTSSKPGNEKNTRGRNQVDPAQLKIAVPEPSSHLHVSALRLWMSLLGGVFGDGLRRRPHWRHTRYHGAGKRSARQNREHAHS